MLCGGVSVPATVDMNPVSTATFRILLLYVSAMYMLPAGSVMTSEGRFKVASRAGPPSPSDPANPRWLTNVSTIGGGEAVGEGVGNFDGFVVGCDEGNTLGWEVGYFVEAWIGLLRKLSVENAQKTEKKCIGGNFWFGSRQIRPRGSLAREFDDVKSVEYGDKLS